MREQQTKSSPGVLSDEYDSRTGGGRETILLQETLSLQEIFFFFLNEKVILHFLCVINILKVVSS